MTQLVVDCGRNIKPGYKQLGHIGTLYDGIVTRSTMLGKLMDSIIWSKTQFYMDE